jgi:hypothetical protein
MTTKSRMLSAAMAALLGLALGGAGAAVAQQAGTTQVSPQATEPLPAQGAGQAAQGAAVAGSSPGPGQPTTLDDSQEQRGVLLKPGAGADDMGAASGATAPPSSEPAQ